MHVDWAKASTNECTGVMGLWKDKRKRQFPCSPLNLHVKAHCLSALVRDLVGNVCTISFGAIKEIYFRKK